MLTAAAIPASAVVTCEYLACDISGIMPQSEAVLLTDAYSAGLPFRGVLAGYLASGFWVCEHCRYVARLGCYEAYVRSVESDATVWLRSQLNAPGPQGWADA